MIYIVGSVGFLMGLMFGYCWGFHDAVEHYKTYLERLHNMATQARKNIEELMGKDNEY